MISLKAIHHKEQENLSVPDLTSMLDIFFILLFFLMMIVGNIFQTLDIKLPQSISTQLPLLEHEKKIILEIGPEKYALNGQSLSNFSDLKSHFPLVRKANPNYKLLIAGEKSIPMERLLEVLSYLQSQNVELANIVMQHKSSSP